MKQLLLFLLVIGLSSTSVLRVQAQTAGQVTGRLLDERQQPLPFATILLQALPDTSVVKAERSGADGTYAFTGVAAGQYRITALMLGYGRYRSAPFELTMAQPVVQVPDGRLAVASHQLTEVQVVGQKSLLEMENGKMIINVAASPTAAGATALEALQKVPGLVVMNNRISLAGREGVVILLDGRTTHYTDVVSVLRDFPSSNIEKIEVVTQPGAAYDAAGSAGIINVILKKNTALGTNGALTLATGYGRFGKGSGTLDLNHRSNVINTFGSYAYTYRKTYDLLNTDRVVEQDGQRLSYQQQSYQPRTSQINTGRVGADYSISRHQTLGVLLSGYTTGTDVNAVNHIEVMPGAAARTDTHTDSHRRTDSYAGNLNYKLLLDSLGRELTADADYSDYRTTNGNRLTNIVQRRDGPMQQWLRFDQRTSIQLWSAKADYLHPLSPRSKLALGAKVSAADIDSRLNSAKLVSDVWQPTAGLSDHFSYQERISAAYASLEQRVAGLQIQAGLRIEQSHTVATSAALGQTVHRDYWQLFPSLSIDKPLTTKLGVNMAYSRRIDRPSYQDLNPSIVYLDPYTQQKGNPFLQPQFTNSFKMAATYQKQPVLLLAYNRTTDAISLATAQQDSVVYSTSTNLGRLENYSATLNLPINLGKLVSGYGGANVFYNHYSSEYLGGQYRNGKLSAMFYLQSKVSLPQGVSLEVSGMYHTAGVNGLVNFRPFGALNLGLQKSFLHDQAQFRLAASDVFFTSKQRGTVRYQDMNINFFTQTESQQLRASFTYKFGNQRLQAARKRSTSLEEERGRVKTDKE